MAEVLVLLAFWGLPILAGLLFGRAIEKRHFLSIIAREKAQLHLPTTSLRVPLGSGEVVRCELVTGSVVISIDYFKRAVASLRSLVGGKVTSYETLLDRARREAVLRLKAACPGADEILNLRLDTCSISKNVAGEIGSVEVLASGTAIYYRNTNHQGAD